MSNANVCKNYTNPHSFFPSVEPSGSKQCRRHGHCKVRFSQFHHLSVHSKGVILHYEQYQKLRDRSRIKLKLCPPPIFSTTFCLRKISTKLENKISDVIISRILRYSTSSPPPDTWRRSILQTSPTNSLDLNSEQSSSMLPSQSDKSITIHYHHYHPILIILPKSL